MEEKRSFLDLDFYKISMGQFVWKHFPDTIVKYEFKNRTKGVKLAEIVPVVLVGDAIRRYGKLKITEEEAQYLKSLGTLEDGYIEFLKNINLPRPVISEPADGQMSITVEGKWSEAIYWETVILSEVNELYCLVANTMNGPSKIIEGGRKRLMDKISVLKKYPDIRFSDFGTRRRHSLKWHSEVIETLVKEVPGQLTGTSNVHLAMKYGIKPIGTMAHEMFMVGSALFGDSDVDILGSHGKILDLWYEYYGEKLSTALTDTYGTDFFFKDFGYERAKKWKGLRQDSGDTFIFANKALEFYTSLGINPKEKMIVFSDGLDINKIISLHNSYCEKIGVTFGWGTNLTQDFEEIAPLSLVMKAVECNGKGLVKLSDNIAKATGLEENVERFKRIFGYVNNKKENLVY
jgi:nicotinate phosphoribosyltransferase